MHCWGYKVTAFCIKKYLDDTSVISIDNNRRLDDNPDDVYPSISICLREGLFVDTNFVQGSDIENMVKGYTEFNKSFFENVTYEDMTITLQIEALLLSKPQLNHNSTQRQPNITSVWLDTKMTLHTTSSHRNSMSAISQLLLTRF